MKLSVKAIQEGKEYSLEVENDSVSVREVKQLLGGMLAVPMEQQSLVYKGRALSDSQRLCDYSIADGAQLYAVPKPVPSTEEPPAEPPKPDQPGGWKNHTMHRNLLYLFLRDHFTVEHSKNIIGCYEAELRKIVYGTSLDLVEFAAVESLKLTEDQ